MADEYPGITSTCPKCGHEFITLRWSDEWRVIHRDDTPACIVSKDQAHILLEGRPEVKA